jgi:outer membrane protein assembly factor BamA
LALFVDAGNVWNLQGGADKNPASVFQWGQFYRQIAVGTGVGIRFDLEVLLLRLDFAIPLSIPWLPEGQRWVGNQIDFGDPSWRKDNLNFSLAFGYPF